MRLALCCSFQEQPIKFVNTTATAALRLPRAESLAKISTLCLANTDSPQGALAYCVEQGIGGFRINSQILPLKTHPGAGYDIADLPHAEQIVAKFRACGAFAQQNNLRLSFHPDQFVVLNSARPEVVAASIAEIEYQAEVADWVGADVVNIHGGGAFGDKLTALQTLRRAFDRLSPRAREKLTLENDDKIYTPADLLPICREAGVPLVFDVHHHRCLKDGMSIDEATSAAIETWNREPMFHISSPLEGWDGPQPLRHHDYIDINDFPKTWRTLDATIEVEAKAKELAVIALRDALAAKPKSKSKTRRA
ncbi:MAG: UV DNA damage repair endonuclease UvsE [Gemmataceae bacterium]